MTQVYFSNEEIIESLEQERAFLHEHYYESDKLSKVGLTSKALYLSERANWSWDTNYGRFSDSDYRRIVHNALVKDALRKGLGDVDIMACVGMMIGYDLNKDKNGKYRYK